MPGEASTPAFATTTTTMVKTKRKKKWPRWTKKRIDRLNEVNEIAFETEKHSDIKGHIVMMLLPKISNRSKPFSEFLFELEVVTNDQKVNVLV